MLKLFNTLSRQKEIFKPLDSTVTMYSCGPTVYSYAHIGNMRAYIFMDSIRRVLKYNGYKLLGMMNITDVGHLLSDADDGEDKLEKAGKEQQKSPYEIAQMVTQRFMQDIEKLRVEPPEIVARATEHIDDMLEFVYELWDAGYAYETSDGIYFDISKFPDYGKLSGQNPEELLAGARVEINSEKRHPADFALWKKAPKEHIMQWDSRFGMGFPGWHIECSAMSRKYLGNLFDIHTGGIDHIPIHHENEIAQSEALTGKSTVNYWLHGEFMLVDGGKMSKSLGNTYTLSDLESMGFMPLDFRYFCLNTHYRKKLNFTFEALEGAKTARERLYSLLAQHKEGTNKADKNALQNYRNEFECAINDDINIPLAIGILWTMLKEPFSREIFDLAIEFDCVLGLDFSLNSSIPIEDTLTPPQEVADLLALREKARQNKDYKTSDELRDKIAALGYSVLDYAVKLLFQLSYCATGLLWIILL